MDGRRQHPDRHPLGDWAEYLHQLAACRAADEKSRSARVAYLAELPPCPDDVLPGHHHEAYRWLYEPLGQLRDNQTVMYCSLWPLLVVKLSPGGSLSSAPTRRANEASGRAGTSHQHAAGTGANDRFQNSMSLPGFPPWRVGQFTAC